MAFIIVHPRPSKCDWFTAQRFQRLASEPNRSSLLGRRWSLPSGGSHRPRAQQAREVWVMNVRTLIAVIGSGCLAITTACNRSNNADADASATTQGSSFRIVLGAELPDFALASLDDSTVVVTRADLAGKIYLIDFWATWCLPCVAELPNLHRAYEAYRSRGFEILSVALGDRRDEIARIRQTDLTMPWVHAFEHLGGEATEVFDLFGIPKAILVDSSNTIIGLDEDVRGEHLQEALARLFGDGN